MNTAVSSSSSASAASLQRRAAVAWAGLAPREKRLVALAAALVLLALLWTVAVRPAWQTLARAGSEIDRLDAQLQTMQRLAAEAQALRATPALAPDQAAAALRAATERLGEQAQLQLQGERAVLTLKGVPPSALRAWLAEARAGARARPVAAALQKTGDGFSGTLELALGGATP
jgi:general secretion pathway protein M